MMYREFLTSRFQSSFPSYVQPLTFEPPAEYDQVTQVLLRYSLRKGLLRLRKLDYMPILLITGRSGMGKTTSALELARRYSKDVGGNFHHRADLHRQMIAGRHEVILIEDVESRFKRGDLLFIDEIQHFVHRFRATSEENVEFSKFVDTVRKFGIIAIVGTSPRIQAVSSEFIDQCQLWLNAYQKDVNNKKTEFVINVNAITADGKTYDWITKGRVYLPWTSLDVFNVSVDLINEKIYSVKGFVQEDIRERKKRLRKEARLQAQAEKVQEILEAGWLDRYEKAEQLLRVLNMNASKVTRLLQKEGYDIKYKEVLKIKSELELETLQQSNERGDSDEEE